MEANIPYCFSSSANNELHIEDIGNFYLHAIDNAEGHHYLVIITYLGFSLIMQWGPIYYDNDSSSTHLSDISGIDYNCNINKVKFSKAKITKTISNFLSYYKRSRDGVVSVISAFEEDKNKVLYRFPELKSKVELLTSETNWNEL